MKYIITIQLTSTHDWQALKRFTKRAFDKTGTVTRIGIKADIPATLKYSERVLEALEKTNDLTTEELRSATHMRIGRLRNILKTLENEGLVISSPSGFKNGKSWHLTDDDGVEDN
ncbi:MAG: hypothetical protein LC687_05190 [Actinobacteria bacterium]|nr:hypothetical protein [Actinomycetota bacterium]